MSLTIPGEDAPNDPHLAERPVNQQRVWQGHFLDVRRDLVRLPSGAEATREYIQHPGAVMIVPLLDDGRLLMERQYRYPVGRVVLEFPAGKIDPNESLLQCAVRELAEETGYRAAEWARAGVLHNAIAYSTEGIEVWFARGLVAGPQRLDDGEFLELCALAPDVLESMIPSGEITDAKTIVGLLWWRRWYSGSWVLDWHPTP